MGDLVKKTSDGIERFWMAIVRPAFGKVLYRRSYKVNKIPKIQNVRWGEQDETNPMAARNYKFIHPQAYYLIWFGGVACVLERLTNGYKKK